MEKQYYVYHIKRPGMSLSEGYIGISNNPAARMRSHQNQNKNAHLTNAFNKYDDIEQVILMKCTIEYAKFIEEKLRPSDNIGWNIVKGGGLPPQHASAVAKRSGENHYLYNKSLDESTRQKMSEAHSGENNHMYGVASPMTGENHTDESKDKIRESKMGRNNPRADLTVYTWVHPEHGEITTDRIGLRDMFPGVNTKSLGKLITGQSNSHRKWKLKYDKQKDTKRGNA